MRRKKERSILYPLLLMALAANTTVAFITLSNLSRPQDATRQAAMMERREERAAEIAVIPPTASTIATKPATSPRLRPATEVAPKEPPLPERRETARAAAKSPQGERAEEITLFPKTVLYRITRSTTLMAREGKERIFLPAGTRVHVAGLAKSGKALVVSKNGNPDGFVPGWALEEVRDEGLEPASSYPLRPEASRQRSQNADFSMMPRVSVGPYGGSIGLGPAYIYVSREGQVSGYFSR